MNSFFLFLSELIVNRILIVRSVVILKIHHASAIRKFCPTMLELNCRYFKIIIIIIIIIIIKLLL